MVANPYPCAIDFGKFIMENMYSSSTNPTGTIEGTIWVWDDNNSQAGRGNSTDYLTINTLGVIGGSPKNNKQWGAHLGTAQGFFVKVSADAGVAYGNHQLRFNDSMKVQSNNADSSFFRQALAIDVLDRLKLSMSDESGSYDETLIGFRSDATLGNDVRYDAVKLDARGGLRLYSLGVSSQSLAIQGLPQVSGVMGNRIGNECCSRGRLHNQL